LDRSIVLLLSLYLLFCTMGCFKSQSDLSSQRKEYMSQSQGQVILRLKTQVAGQLKLEFRSLRQAISLRSNEKVPLSFQLTNLTDKNMRVVLQVQTLPLSALQWLDFDPPLYLVSLKPKESYNLESGVTLNRDAQAGNDFINLDLTAIDGSAIPID